MTSTEAQAFPINHSSPTGPTADAIGSPVQDPMAVSMTILYAVILVTGVFGNVCTCIVIFRNRYMRTATNYYLFSLAVSDLLLLILGLPHDIVALWKKRPYLFGELFCFIRGLTSETSTNASVLTITAFTVERYLAICHPLRTHTMSKLSRVVRLIIVIWFLALICAFPLAYQFGICYQKKNGVRDENTAECSIVMPIAYSFEVSFLVFFVFPGILLSVLYKYIALQLRQSEAMKCSNDQFEHKVENANTTSVDTLQAYERSIESGSLISKYRISLVKDNSSYSKFKANPNGEHLKGSLRGSNSAASSTASRRAVIRMLGE